MIFIVLRNKKQKWCRTALNFSSIKLGLNAGTDHVIHFDLICSKFFDTLRQFLGSHLILKCNENKTKLIFEKKSTKMYMVFKQIKITSFNIQRNVASSKLIFSRSALEADSTLKQGSTTSFEASNSAKSLGAIVKRSHPASARISPLFLKIKVRNH